MEPPEWEARINRESSIGLIIAIIALQVQYRTGIDDDAWLLRKQGRI